MVARTRSSGRALLVILTYILCRRALLVILTIPTMQESAASLQRFYAKLRQLSQVSIASLVCS